MGLHLPLPIPALQHECTRLQMLLQFSSKEFGTPVEIIISAEY